MAASSSASALPTRVHSNLFWSDPAAFRASVPRLAVLLLNAPHPSWKIRAHVDAHTRNRSTELFWNLWSNAHVTLCADGGANRLYDRSVQVDAQALAVPHYIKGDLDSLRDDVRAFYTAKGTQVVHDPDQDSNDLDKCLQLLQTLQQDQADKFTVVIFGAMGGRFDQEIQNINALFRWGSVFESIALLSEDTTVRLLVPGVHHVIEPNFEFETRTCGLVPLAGMCKSTVTSGFKWDLDGTVAMGFGGLISTSNHVLHDSRVTVECSEPLIWTTELQK
jgi:thiamine pyrophosphokinase